MGTGNGPARTTRHRAAGYPAAIGELGRALTAAAQDRPLPDWAADAGRTEDIRRRRARQALLEAIARHHHGSPAGPGTRRPAVVISRARGAEE
ncbi:hypothetical protein ACWC5I_40660 [Kitasatospora sp. NPDC001574]